MAKLSADNFNNSYTRKLVLLILEIPKANESLSLPPSSLFASLHGILREKKELRLNSGVQEHLSFEDSLGKRANSFLRLGAEKLAEFCRRTDLLTVSRPYKSMKPTKTTSPRAPSHSDLHL